MNLGLMSNFIKENTSNNNKTLNNSLEKISTGLKINKASDDASGLSIADKLRTQATGIKQSIENANSAIAMLNIADKGMSELSNILDIIKTKSIQMKTDTTSQEGRKIIKTEILKLIEQYDDIVCRTNYNETALLNGCASPFNFQMNDTLNDIISVNVDSVESRYMGNDDPYKLKNFITGFNPIMTDSIVSESNINNILSSDISGFNTLSWIKNVDGTYQSSGVVDLSSKTEKLIDINPDYIKDIEFTFINFGALSERFTLSDGMNIIGQISGNDYSGNEIENVILDINYADSWDYSSLENTSDGTVRINGIKKNISVYATGDYLILNKIVLTLQDVLPSSVNSVSNIDCSCDDLTLVRNDDSPTLLIQAQKLMEVVDKALTQLNIQRSNIGAGTNQIESSARNLMTDYVNIKNAESIIRDVDYAEETSNFNKSNIISQASSFVQIQANQIDQQSVTNLLK